MTDWNPTSENGQVPPYCQCSLWEISSAGFVCHVFSPQLCVGFLFPRASERRVLPIVGVCISSSHLHTFSSSHLLSHLLIFTSAHLHICSSSDLLSHLLIFTSAHLYIFSHIFSHICSSSHLLIFTSSLTSSLTSAHLHICSSSHLLSHLLIFTSAHLHICSSSHLLSHLLIFTSCLLSLSLFSLSPSLSFSL